MTDSEKPIEGGGFDWDEDPSGVAGDDAGAGNDLERSDAEREAQALVSWRDERDRANAVEEALFKAQMAEAEKLSPEYVPPSEPLTPIEEAAKVASQMDRAEL